VTSAEPWSNKGPPERDPGQHSTYCVLRSEAQDSGPNHSVLPPMTDPYTFHADGHTTAAASDRWVPWLLSLGGLTIIGWFVGVVFLWWSRTWTIGDKVAGTLLVPLGMAPGLYLFVTGTIPTSCTYNSATNSGSRICVAGPGVAGIWEGLILMGVSVLVAFHLERVRRASP
jgi:hypothetical protein